MNAVRRKVMNAMAYLNADRISFPDEKTGERYLIYRYDGHSVGLMTKMLSVLGWLKYAGERGLTLVIDMLDPDVFGGSRNVWECFFRQPMMTSSVGRSDAEALMAERCCALAPVTVRYHYRFSPRLKPLMALFPPTIDFPGIRDYKNNTKDHERFRALYRKYISFQPEVREYLDGEYDALLAGKGKILGVRVRGTDYVQRRPYHHPVQLEVGDLIRLAGELKEKNRWDYIYLATEEKKTEELFEKAFPGMIITNKRQYLDGDYSASGINDGKRARENDHYLNELEYLSSMNLLSRCDLLIGGLCGGMQAVLIMHEGEYEYLNILDLGDY